jgi:hypothetical protein
MELSFGMSFFQFKKAAWVRKCQLKTPAGIPQSGIFLSGCKDTFCEGIAVFFFELMKLFDWVD